MKIIVKIFAWTTAVLLFVLSSFLVWFYASYGGSGRAFPNLATVARWPADSLRKVAILPEPPGNIAVSKEGRIFCTYHAESHPDLKVWELVDGKPVPFPDAGWQNGSSHRVFLDAIFNIRIDAKNHLWTLDHGQNGFKTPRLLCFDINSKKLINQIDFPTSICGPGSYIQDMALDTAGKYIYVADLSAFGKTPAIVIVNIAEKTFRRVLQKDRSVMPSGNWSVNNKGRVMRPAGPLFYFHPGLDPIALDRANKFLYYGPMSGDTLYRIGVDRLNDKSLSSKQLSALVEPYAKRGQCDGITMDRADNIYLTDIENGSIAVIDRSRHYQTLVSHPAMRWPDGLGMGADGYVYVSDSDIPDVMMKPKSHIKKCAPFYIWKFKALAPAAAGQ